MSQARFEQPERSSVPYARCRRQPGDVYAPQLYSGRQRAARLADEAGALCVVELHFGGRLAVYAIDGEREWRRVERLP